MPRKREIYPKDPIVEAVSEFRFLDGASWSAVLGEQIRARLGEAYPGLARPTQDIELQAQVLSAGLATSSKATLRSHLFPSTDGTRLLGVGDHLLSVHVLKPYPGWEEFRARTAAALVAYSQETNAKKIRSFGLRYIDSITIPKDHPLSDYFLWMPGRPDVMPPDLMGLHLVLQSSEPTGVIALLRTGTSGTTPDGRPVVIYDLNLLKEYPDGLSVDSWLSEAESLHTRLRDIFEDSITEQTRGLFR